MMIKSMKMMGALSCCMWLAMAMATLAQDNAAVLDTTGEALQAGVDYYIKPAITDSGGRFTLIDRNNSCPRYVGQELTSLPQGFPVTFSPFVEGENVVRESRDEKVTFSAATICVQSTTWKVGETQPESDRRLIVTGIDENEGIAGPAGNYFRVNKREDIEGVYSMQWCPTELCATCRFRCGDVGVLVENGKRLLALDGSALPVVFERA